MQGIRRFKVQMFKIQSKTEAVPNVQAVQPLRSVQNVNRSNSVRKVPGFHTLQSNAVQSSNVQGFNVPEGELVQIVQVVQPLRSVQAVSEIKIRREICTF